MKTCFKCHQSKSIGDFYKHSAMADGHLGKCKECTKKDVKIDRASKLKQYSEYEKMRFKTPQRKKTILNSQRKRRRGNPKKYRVHAMVARAVKKGTLIKTPCVKCGNPKSQAHHDDYDKPLDVKWVCFKCHREVEHGQTVVSC